MSNKTLIPAFKASVGDWSYYICIMKYGEVARQVSFVFELNGNNELNGLLQRGLSERSAEIKEYLKHSSHRFLGALVVAAWGGDPHYTEVRIAESEDGMLAGLDQRFGVLTFDGTQQYFALDGQHRLKAIKDAIKENPDLGKEDICVLLVSHFENEEGRRRTRRLFTNINRHAKATTVAENIALDEDDGFAIISRQLLTDHPFLREDGRVRALLGTNGEGDIKLASKQVPKHDRRAFTTLGMLYECIKALGFGLDPAMQSAYRPTDEVLDASYEIIVKRIDDLLDACGQVRSKLVAVKSAADIRAPKGHEGDGHAFMRPLIQLSICRVLRWLVEQGTEWDELLGRLRELQWHLHDPPWIVVASSEGKMRTNREYVELLDHLLIAHIAPPSKQSIKNARKEYKGLFEHDYPVSEAELEKNLNHHHT